MATEPSAVRYFARRVVRHVRWARREGLGRLVAEDRLDPRERLRTAAVKRRWRRRHGVRPGAARAVYLVGLQRSGTNMLVRGLDAAPEVEVRNENDRTVFRRFRLRGDDVLAGVVRRSRHAIVLVKPLCDSHRVAGLLALTGGRALWAWRDVDQRARSEVAKFGAANLRALRAVADGTIGDGWQGGGLGPDTRELLRSFDYDELSPHDGAALFWYVRNDLFFRLGLARRPDVALIGYDAMVADPEGTTRRLCAFLDLPYRAEFAAGVVAGPPREPLPIDGRVRALCDELTGRLTAAGREAARG